ncbi:MAG: rRNA maturation RNase YbeY [Candidatus Eisenbacteria bacterium]
MAVTVTARFPTRSLTAPLTRLVTVALAPESARPGEIAIVLGDDATLRELNRRYRGIDRATDVLSFAYEEDSPTPALLPAARVGAGRRRVSGDLVISLPRVAEQARRYRVTPGHELARLIVHGVLHLTGLDHDRAAERRHMRAREERVLARAKTPIEALDRLLGRPVRTVRGHTRAAHA